MVLNERRMHSRFCGGETGSIVVRVRPIHRLSSPPSGGHSADPVAGMTSECVSAFSRHVVPEVCIFFAPIGIEGWPVSGITGVAILGQRDHKFICKHVKRLT